MRSGRVIVVGERPRRYGRAITVISTFGESEQQAAMRLLALFAHSHYSGFACSKFERLHSGGFRDLAPSEAAAAARRVLAAIQRRLTAEHWSIVWHVLLFDEPQHLYALRVRCRKADVRPRLQAALMAVATLSRAR